MKRFSFLTVSIIQLSIIYTLESQPTDASTRLVTWNKAVEKCDEKGLFNYSEIQSLQFHLENGESSWLAGYVLSSRFLVLDGCYNMSDHFKKFESFLCKAPIHSMLLSVHAKVSK